MTVVHISREMAEGMAEKARMAMAEAGYPDAEVDIYPIDPRFGYVSGLGVGIGGRDDDDVYQEAVGRALLLITPRELHHTVPCLDCFRRDPRFENGIAAMCVAGECPTGRENMP